MATTLQTYITQCRRLLADATGTYWSNTELTDYINDGRNRIVVDSSCNRSIASITLNVVSATGTGAGSDTITGVSPAPDQSWIGAALIGTGLTGLASSSPIVQQVNGTDLVISGTADVGMLAFTYYQEAYPFSDITTSSGEPIISVLNITAVWGNVRYALAYKPWTHYNALMRSYVQFQQRPAVWSMQGQNVIWIGPIVDQQYVVEWDCVTQPAPLVNAGDIETIAYPYDESVKYWACYLAQLRAQSPDKAAQFRSLYQQTAAHAIAGNIVRRIPNVYQDL